MKLLPFHYYAYPGAKPILVEIDQDGYVYMSHNDQVIHRAKYGGEFIPLVEFHGNGCLWVPVEDGERIPFEMGKDVGQISIHLPDNMAVCRRQEAER